MLNGNKLVILLPLILMGFIFYGGYHYLQETAAITNEQLHQVVDVTAELEQAQNSVVVTGDWLWGGMPSEGLIGEDYLGVSLQDAATGEPLNSEAITGAVLQLVYGDSIIYEDTGTIVDNGIIFTFPNKVIEHESYGDKGMFTVTFQKQEAISPKVSIVMLHTWKEHEGIVMEDARMVQPQFSETMIDYYWLREWVVE